jgi:AcrR family transcriptional regulator
MGAPMSKVEQGEATRTALLDAARELFMEHGYRNVGTEEIVRRAEVTRGALYHHFDDKKDLMRAVYERVEQESVATVGTRIADFDDPIDAMVAGLRAYLDFAQVPGFAHLVFNDAPAVLGWREWREIDKRHGLGLIALALQTGIEAGAVRPQPVQPLAPIVLGAIIEASQEIAFAADPLATRKEVESALIGLLLDGLRVADTGSG